MSVTNNAGEKESLPTQVIIDFILEIARHITRWGIADGQAITIAQKVIGDFSKRYSGEAFYFNSKKDSTGKVFLESVLNEQLQKCGIPVKDAARIAGAVIDKFFLQFATLHIYIPLGKVLQGEALLARNKAITKEYRQNPTFNTIRRLAAQHNMTIRNVYKIIGSKPGQLAKTAGKLNRIERNAAIVAAYNKKPAPGTIKRLAHEYALQVSTIYGIIWRAVE